MNASENRAECALRLKNIVKTYGEGEFKVQALKGVDFCFRKNEFVSILGPSGCGKTTLLNIIGGLDRYTSGDLIIEGRSTKGYSDKDWDAYRNNCIGFVFQSYNLIPHQTVLANVELALELSGMTSKERKRRAMEMLARVGLGGQEHKKPNQLSGGQMQRVAIARALVNDPEIILADEPTGALDTETSVQVMNLLKEVAKDRLVIMVTHNPELAEKYSTRIIRLLDGEKVGDTNPFDAEENKSVKTLRKPRMGFKTAFALSIKNLFSKKTRTILTSVAGSIGIIGVALVLALSNGFNAYMARMQTDTLATYPLTISESSVDLSTFDDIYDSEVKEKYPALDNVVVEKAFDNLTGMLKSNDLSDMSENGFKHYLEQADPSLYYDIAYSYGFDMNDYFYTDITINGESHFMAIDMLVKQIEKLYNDQLQAAMGLNTSFVRQYIPTIKEMPDSRELIEEQYDVLYGELPSFEKEDYKQMVLVVDEYNGISDISLALLGYLGVNFPESGNGLDVTFGDVDEISIEDIVGKKMYLAKNSIMFSEPYSGYFFVNELENPETSGAENTELEELEIVGIIRAKEKVNGILPEGFAYTPALTERVISVNKDSAIAQAAKAAGTLNIYGGIDTSTTPPTPTIYETVNARVLAGIDTPSQINIYARNFESKEAIKAYIDEWNARYSDNEELQITYSDMMSMMFGMLNTMVNAVTYVLIAFTSISLVVSSVMIGIITYISVVERTKEIGVLRALGAAKGEIANVFNAETFLIGLFAGLIGVGVTYLLSIPINLILASLIPDVGSLAILSPIAALVLVVISITLTLIAGLIPSSIAAKKDPVVALRTE